MLKLMLKKFKCNAYGFFDPREIAFDGPSYTTINGEILLNGEHIGRVTMYELNGDVNLYNMANQIPGDTMIIAEHICDRNGNLKCDYNFKKFVILDNLFIEPKYRNKGYGSTIVKHLLDDLQNECIDGIVLYASTYEIDDMSLIAFYRRSEKLIRFYANAGFYNIGDGIMILKKG